MVNANPLLLAALAMGFFGSPHCLGMCGGLVTAFGLSMQTLSPTKKRLLIATYHFGRLLSYSFLGIIAGIIGTTVLAPLIQGNVLPRIILGTVLVVIGLSMLGLPFLNKLEKYGMVVWQRMSPIRQKVFPIDSFPKALSAGLLWGFLPCGLVYGALLMAVVGTDPLNSALLMFAFGLGTIPMLIATQETVGWLHKQMGKFKLRQLNGLIMMASGVAIISVPIVMKNFHSHAGHVSTDNQSSSHNHTGHEPLINSSETNSHKNHLMDNHDNGNPHPNNSTGDTHHSVSNIHDHDHDHNH